MPHVTTYDPSCEDLARHFFAEEEEQPPAKREVAQLALAIQQTVEDWFFDRSRAREQRAKDFRL